MANNRAPLSRQMLERSYNTSRNNLLLVIVFTVINIVLCVTRCNVFFLFSAYIPYALVDLGMMTCGLYPASYYGEDSIALSETLSPTAFVLFLALALIPLVIYLLSWIFSKNNRISWLIVALVFFSVDTALMVWLCGIKLDSAIDILFHIWVIFSLATGISTGRKLKRLPPEELEPDPAEDVFEASAELPDTALRMADDTVKHRVLLETEILGHHVIYRRVKRTNELVIDGRVYDEIEALVEKAHVLSARIGTHTVEVGFDGFAHSYAKLDGVIVEKNLRLI